MTLARRSNVLVSFALACVAYACSNDPGALYCEGAECERTEPPDAAANRSDGDQSTAADPRTVAVRLFGEQCETCLGQECGGEIDACVENEACAEEVQCHARESDPPGHEACTLEYPFGHEPSNKLMTCARDHCLDRCPLGQDYECTGRYSWPAPVAATTLLPLQLGQFVDGAQPLQAGGIRVRACPSRSELDCPKSPLQPVESTPTGEVDVILPNRGGNNNGYQPFDGYLMFDDPGRDPPRIFTTRLFIERGPGESGNKRTDALLATPSGPFRPTAEAGFILGVIMSCTSGQVVRAVGLSVELDPEPGTLLVLPANNVTDHQGAFFALGAPPGMTRITARFAEQVITETTVPVVAGEASYVWLWPRTE